jgi:hypothetical protein
MSIIEPNFFSIAGLKTALETRPSVESGVLYFLILKASKYTCPPASIVILLIFDQSIFPDESSGDGDDLGIEITLYTVPPGVKVYVA